MQHLFIAAYILAWTVLCVSKARFIRRQFEIIGTEPGVDCVASFLDYVAQGNVALVQQCLGEGAVTTIDPDDEGNVPLVYAIDSNAWSVVSILSQPHQGTCPASLPNAAGQTAIHFALGNGISGDNLHTILQACPVDFEYRYKRNPYLYFALSQGTRPPFDVLLGEMNQNANSIDGLQIAYHRKEVELLQQTLEYTLQPEEPYTNNRFIYSPQALLDCIGSIVSGEEADSDFNDAALPILLRGNQGRKAPLHVLPIDAFFHSFVPPYNSRKKKVLYRVTDAAIEHKRQHPDDASTILSNVASITVYGKVASEETRRATEEAMVDFVNRVCKAGEDFRSLFEPLRHIPERFSMESLHSAMDCPDNTPAHSNAKDQAEGQ